MSERPFPGARCRPLSPLRCLPAAPSSSPESPAPPRSPPPAGCAADTTPPVIAGTQRPRRSTPTRYAILAAVAPVLLDGALPASRRRGGRGARNRRQRRSSRSRACRPRRRRSCGQLFALLASPPARIALARVTSPWPQATPRRNRRVPRPLAHEPIPAPPLGLRRAASARVRRVVRQSGARGQRSATRARRDWLRMMMAAERSLAVGGRARLERHRRVDARARRRRSKPTS